VSPQYVQCTLEREHLETFVGGVAVDADFEEEAQLLLGHFELDVDPKVLSH